MRAVVLRDHQLFVEEVSDPKPQPGQLLSAVRACGICGSDLHSVAHGDALVRAFGERHPLAPREEIAAVTGDFAREIVMGHEFCVEVLEASPSAPGFAAGDTLVSLPYVFDADGGHGLGYSNRYPGGFAERMLVSADVAVHVPNGLDASLAVLTEPSTVAEHAVAISAWTERHGSLVIGCGPIGLALIASLVRRGTEPILAADFSAVRREAALRLGAHAVIDPREDELMGAWFREGREQPLLIFEAVGAPGVLDEAIRFAPKGAQLVVVGICLVPDRIELARAFASELNVQFAAFYSPEEFAATLRAIAEGELAVAPMVTGAVGLGGVPAAFETLAEPETHAKILVQPKIDGAEIQTLRA